MKATTDIWYRVYFGGRDSVLDDFTTYEDALYFAKKHQNQYEYYQESPIRIDKIIINVVTETIYDEAKGKAR